MPFLFYAVRSKTKSILRLLNRCATTGVSGGVLWSVAFGECGGCFQNCAHDATSVWELLWTCLI